MKKSYFLHWKEKKVRKKRIMENLTESPSKLKVKLKAYIIANTWKNTWKMLRNKKTARISFRNTGIKAEIVKNPR